MEFSRRATETPLSWLGRLAAIEVKELSPAQRRARTACMAEARRLRQEEQQGEKWRKERE
jgi:hypothetical protein